MINKDFISFMESVVLPTKTANPDRKRLDGKASGGNRLMVGRLTVLERFQSEGRSVTRQEVGI